jgi:hypothetical protein
MEVKFGIRAKNNTTQDTSENFFKKGGRLHENKHRHRTLGYMEGFYHFFSKLKNINKSYVWQHKISSIETTVR